MLQRLKTLPNPVFPDDSGDLDPSSSHISRLERMGFLCSVLKLIATLRAPYRCIVRCGYNAMKASWLMIALGVILLYFFWDNMFDSSGLKRYFGLLGLVLLTMGIAFFSMGLSICVFYIRLYKAHEKQLHELSRQAPLAVRNYLASPDRIGPTSIPTSSASPRQTTRSPSPKRNSDATAAQIWTIQQNQYPYNVPQPSAPPPPMDAFGHIYNPQASQSSQYPVFSEFTVPPPKHKK